MKHFAPWLAGLYVLVLRLTCRLRYHNDPRKRLEVHGIKHVIAALHAEQIAGSLGAETGSGTMVSRSADGEIVVPALRVSGHVPIRGSSGSAKGGATALHALIDHVRNGRPAMLAVDGPRGPRGSVQKGIGLLAQKTDAAVVAVVAIPSRRWILSKTWDRLQLPKPFCWIDYYFSHPLVRAESESLDQFVTRVQRELNRLEAKHDPLEGTRIPDSGEARDDLHAAA